MLIPPSVGLDCCTNTATRGGMRRPERRLLAAAAERLRARGTAPDGDLVWDPETRYPSQKRHPRASAQLLLEDPVLLDQVLDDLLLATAHPAGKGDQEELKWLGRGAHAPIVNVANCWLRLHLRRGRVCG